MSWAGGVPLLGATVVECVISLPCACASCTQIGVVFANFLGLAGYSITAHDLSQGRNDSSKKLALLTHMIFKGASPEKLEELISLSLYLSRCIFHFI